MILHGNAALSHRQRERLVALVFAGATITAAALVVGCSRPSTPSFDVGPYFQLHLFLSGGAARLQFGFERTLRLS